MSEPTVFVVDDDPAVRDSLGLLLETAGLSADCHDSAESFLAAYNGKRPGCVILDVRMQQMSGPELQAELIRRGLDLPIIFLTAHGDIPMTVRAIKAERRTSSPSRSMAPNCSNACTPRSRTKRTS